MKGKSLLPITLSLLLVLGLGGGIGGLWEEARAEGPEAPGEAPLLSGPMGTGFTYQGQLIKDGNPVDDTCDFEFGLWDDESAGSQVGGTQTETNVTVSDGLFTVQLDFGDGAFQGDARWLKIAVRCPAGGDGYTALSPRQPLTPTPYALALYGLWTQQNATSPNLIGGYSGNSVTVGVAGATISGGGAWTWANRVMDHFGTVGGGYDNEAGYDDGDPMNQVGATVGGGKENEARGSYATVAGGFSNYASGSKATIGGGGGNTAVEAYATVGGGDTNSAGGSKATVAGGQYNYANGQSATIGGGRQNGAEGDYATVPGGYQNTAQGEQSRVLRLG